MKSIIFKCCLLACIFNFSCKKFYTDLPPALPAETHSGKETLGFLLNGQIWLPKSKGIDAGPPIGHSLQFQILNLSGTRLNQSLIFGIPYLSKVGEYNLTDNDILAVFFDNNKEEKNREYKCTSGIVNVTYYDEQKGIVSGTFNLKAVNAAGEEVSIDQGRFDVTF